MTVPQLEALLTSLETELQTLEAEVGYGGASFTKELIPGSTGPEVTRLQNTLYADGDYPRDIITGDYGSLTEAAVKAFQEKYGIVDYGSPSTTGYGSVGPKTRVKLNTLL